MRFLAQILFVPITILWSCQQKETSPDTSLFEEISALTSRVDFRNDLPESAAMNSFVYEYYYNGGGVAIGDVNQDGWEDLFFTSNLGANRLYINTGDFQFIDVSQKAGIQGKEGWTTGVSMVDINADGKLDIYVCYSGPFDDPEMRANELFINQGTNDADHPIFIESAAAFGLADTSFSTQAAYIDYDLDGDLDMFLLNHNPGRIAQDVLINGRETNDPIGDKFYENVGNNFVDKTLEVGIYSNAISYGLGVSVGDVNQDGWPDIYVSNDYEEMDYLYLNQKDKSFDESIKKTTRHISNFSMGNDMADYDNDGFLDILVLDMVSEDNYGIKTSMPSMNPALFNQRVAQGFHHQYMYNTLQRHTSHVSPNGLPTFTDAGRLAGITNTGWSWAPLMVDFDNDGYKDLFISNGIKRDFRNNDFNVFLKKTLSQNPDFLDDPRHMQEVLNKIPKKPLKNYFYKNNGDLSFSKSTSNWLPDLKASLSNGAAYGDLDNDGDYDLVINNIDASATILRNHSKENHVTIQYQGVDENPGGIGAKMYVWIGNQSQYFENYTVRGFQSSVSPKTIIGLGENKYIDSLAIVWPSGKSEKRRNIAANSVVVWDETKAQHHKVTAKPKKGIFDNTKTISGLSHVENAYDDYQKQALLPHKLSQLGPALIAGDINNDGLEDLFLGQSSGTASSIWLQTKNGDFTISQHFEEAKESEDVDALFFDYDMDGDLDLYVVTGGNEFAAGHAKYADRLYLNENGNLSNATKLLPPIFESGSVVKACDYNNDGRLDLFVGTRHVPGDYPSPANSVILKNTPMGFVDVTKDTAPSLPAIGLVTDAIWSDFDHDKDMDIILVGEWMKPTVLLNTDGKFAEASISGLDSLTGWYHTIRQADVDQDGQMDYLLGNLGENYKYKATVTEPFEVYYADFDDSGHKDIVLGYYNFGQRFPVRGRQCSSQQIPELSQTFANYHSFGSSTLSEIYPIQSTPGVLALKAYNFSSGILKNGNDGFQFVPFPNLAQLSSVNDILVDDYNGDGHIDLLIAGNLYGSEIETPRNDSGYGLLLIGDSSGAFSAVDSYESGFYTEGELRHLVSVAVGKEHYVMAATNHSDLVFHHLVK